MVWEAATAKKDEKILKIRDKDCVAIKVRYHQKCCKITPTSSVDKSSALRQSHLFFMLLALRNFAKM